MAPRTVSLPLLMHAAVRRHAVVSRSSLAIAEHAPPFVLEISPFDDATLTHPAAAPDALQAASNGGANNGENGMSSPSEKVIDTEPPTMTNRQRSGDVDESGRSMPEASKGSEHNVLQPKRSSAVVSKIAAAPAT